MKKHIIICLVILAATTTCCEKEWEKYKDCKEWELTALEPQVLQSIHWKLEGFVDIENCTIKRPKCPENWVCEDAYTFRFTGDTVSEGNPWYFTDTLARGLKVFYGETSSNSISGTYETDFETGSFHITTRLSTHVGETSDGYQYCDVLPKVQHFALQENELRLYYNDKKNYLLYKPK